MKALKPVFIIVMILAAAASLPASAGQQYHLFGYIGVGKDIWFCAESKAWVFDSRQAEKKFGTLERRHADLIAKASEDQLQQWLESILSAGAPDDLFRT